MMVTFHGKVTIRQRYIQCIRISLYRYVSLNMICATS